MHKFTKALAAIGLAAVMSQSAMAETLKLGFLVKQPEEPWFQTEWKFADKAGKDLGFEVIKIAVPDGEKTLNAIDSLAASGAKGFVICTPDPKLGAAIVAKARGYDMKVITVDDQFVNAKGKPMESVPLVMMGLDLTHQTVCTPDIIARMEDAGGPAGKLFSDMMNFTLKTQYDNYGLLGGPVHDATCVAYLINPDAFKVQEMYVEIDVNSGPCYGRTVCDELGVLGQAPNTKVGMTLDTDWFWDLVEECVRKYH